MNNLDYLRCANGLAAKARADGNTPFGAVLVGPEGEIIMEQGNAEKDLGDATAHAEMVLASRASRKYPKEYLRTCALVTTVEPCPMCTGGIYWANIGRIVYGITEEQLFGMTGSDDRNPTFRMGAAKVIAAGQKDIAVEGPYPEMAEEIAAVHRGFWDRQGSGDS